MFRRTLLPLIFLAVMASACSQGGKAPLAANDATSWEEVKGHSVAVNLGSVQDLFASSLEGVQVVQVNSIPEILLTVQKGVADYGAVDAVLVTSIDQNENKLKINFLSEDVQETAAAFRKEDVALCEEFNAFLDILHEDGTFEDMNRRWTVAPVDASRMPEIELPRNPKRELVIGTMNEVFPFTYVENAQLVGYEVELLKRFCAYAGYRPVFQDYAFSGLIAALSSGRIDMIVAGMTVTQERAKQVLFSDAYFETSTACISLDNGIISGESSGLWGEIKKSVLDNLIAEGRWKLILEGLWTTIVISFFSIILGTVFGVLVCWMALNRRKWLKYVADAYVSIVQGVPMLVFLMFMFYVVFASTKVTAVWVAVLAFAMNFAAYASDIFASCINGIDKGQNEAGRALGFSKFRTFLYIIAPQAIQRIIPIFKGEVGTLIKNTSIVGYIAIMDLTKASDVIRSRTFDAFFPLIIISIIYFALVFAIGKALDRVAKSTSPQSKQI